MQAPSFTDEDFATAGLDWVVEQLDAEADEQTLDVACGAGHRDRNARLVDALAGVGVEAIVAYNGLEQFIVEHDG